MKRSIVWMLIILSCLLTHIQGQNHVSFFEEHIDFTLDTDYFIINGIYSFYNDAESEIGQQIIFPFAGKTAAIDSIQIVNLSTGSKIRFNRLENSILFSFTLPSRDTVDLNIFYRQKISTINKYIITSTQTWGKPLETAVYTLTTDKKLKIKSFSYTPDLIKEMNNKRLYIWKKQHFMPNVDFEITIEK